MAYHYTKAYSQYGASMGRRDSPGHDADLPFCFHVERVPPCDGGDYDPGGAYWGDLRFSPLYVVYASHEDEYGESYAEHFIRAPDRGAVKAEILPRYPNATFYL